MKSNRVPAVKNPAYLEMAVDYYDLVEIAEDLGLKPDARTLESLQPRLDPTRRRIGKAA